MTRLPLSLPLSLPISLSHPRPLLFVHLPSHERVGWVWWRNVAVRVLDHHTPGEIIKRRYCSLRRLSVSLSFPHPPHRAIPAIFQQIFDY
jgi:hypothetical protein